MIKKGFRTALALALASLLTPNVWANEAPPNLVTAVAEFAKRRAVSVSARPSFRHALVDLNGDDVLDAVVLLTDKDWCGSGGCTMLVLRGTKTRFTLVSSSTITFEPIRISEEVAYGWRTLVVFSKGTGDVLMRFNGSRYPLNPSLQRKATPSQIAATRVLIGR